jgi:hypothetical protein
LLTIADVCDLFKVTRGWVYDEVEASRLPTPPSAESTSASDVEIWSRTWPDDLKGGVRG